jgi:glycosyltransferase involved in cell wall biosynthesis
MVNQKTIKKITVIIPTYNRCDILEKCLNALARQTLSEEFFDIIVVDDGSKDNTSEITSLFKESVSISVLYLWQSNSGQNAARNMAIQEAEGEIVLFINDDTISTPTMLEEHYKVHIAEPQENIAVLGRVTISPEIPPNIFSTLHLDSAYDQWHGKKILDWRAFYTCNLSLKKSFLLEHGLFDVSLRYNDDIELGERLSHHNMKIIYNPNSLGYHYHFIAEDDFFNLAKKNGKSLAVWYKKSPHLKSELVSLGLYTEKQYPMAFKYIVADHVFNRNTRHLFISLARFISKYHEGTALALYKKLYKAIERESIREELGI